jgi:hypothetical protein
MKSLGSPVLGDALYADARRAAAEERAYLHGAALVIPALGAGERSTAVLCAPTQGAEFVTPHFAAWFAKHFPDGEQPASWCVAAAPLLALSMTTRSE